MPEIIERKPFYEERIPGFIPQKDSVRKLTFVTGLDANHFMCVKELIMSLSKTRYYKDVPINILDCGLYPRQKEDLKGLLKGGRIITPSWTTKLEKIYKYNLAEKKLEHFEPPFNQHKMLTSKPYLDQLFPGFDYYCWINSNFWVQDERAIDQYLVMAERQDYSVSTIAWEDFDVPVRSHKLGEFAKKHLSKSDFNKIASMPHICEAVFCVNARSDFFKKWRDNYEKTIDQKNYFYSLTESTAMLTMAQQGAKNLVHSKWFSYYYIPLIYADHPHTLYNIKTGAPMGFIRPVNFINFKHDIFLAQDMYQTSNFKTIKASTRFLESMPTL